MATNRSPRRAAAAVVVLLLVGGTSCRLSVEATIDVNSDGSGVVRAAVGLDDVALAQLADFESQLELSDLEDAGWDVTGPTKEDDGLTWVRAGKAFSEPDEAQRVMAELAGPDGPFREFRVTRSRSLASTQTSFTGLVDLSGGLGGFADADLRQRLGGVDVASRVPPEAVQVSVVVRLPGSEQADAAESLPGGVRWTPPLGKQLRLDATSSSFEPIPAVPGAISLVAALLALVIVLHRRRRPDTTADDRAPLPPDWPLLE